jgi:hypothetical protein
MMREDGQGLAGIGDDMAPPPRQDVPIAGEEQGMIIERVRPPRAPLHVLVVGGGLGGLCLAQGLTKAGLSVAVYERDLTAQVRAQGYRLSLKEEGSLALRDCLPEHLFALCVACTGRLRYP